MSMSAVLEGEGLAAGTKAGTVDLFNFSALELHGPRDPFQKLQAVGRLVPWQSCRIKV